MKKKTVPVFKRGESLALQILRSRGVEEYYPVWKREEDFLRSFSESPFEIDDSFFSDPFLLTDMDRAVSTITAALRQKKKILIHGDYDCDGITATALLENFLKRVGAEVSHYIPDRFEDGYGIGENGISEAEKAGAGLFISVDCGIQSLAEIDRLEDLGIKTVVTDHHLLGNKLPNAAAVVNPKRENEDNELFSLSGAGVALKLTQALNRELGEDFLWERGLALASLGTVSDLMPLLRENRRILKAGLMQMNFKPPVWLSSLIKAQYGTEASVKNADEKMLGFSVAPKINAAGRMGSPIISLELLTEENTDEALKIAEKLFGINKNRKDAESSVLESAFKKIAKNPLIFDSNVIIAAGEGWHEGVLGIIAARLADYYGRPAIVLNESSEGEYKGSARSVKGLNIMDILRPCADLLLSFGGHKAAAGLTLKKDRLPAFKEKIKKAAEKIDFSKLKASEIRVIDIDAAELSDEMADEIEFLRPFGESNPEPAIGIKNFQYSELRAVGKELSHLRMGIKSDGGKNIYGIYFGGADKREVLLKSVDKGICVNLKKNSFRGETSLSFELCGEENEAESRRSLSEKIFYLMKKFPEWGRKELALPLGLKESEMLPGKDALNWVYVNLLRAGIREKALILGEKDRAGLCPEKLCENPDLRGFISDSCLIIYEEAGLLISKPWIMPGKAENTRCYIFVPAKRKQNLYNTDLYKRLSM